MRLAQPFLLNLAGSNPGIRNPPLAPHTGASDLMWIERARDSECTHKNMRTFNREQRLADGVIKMFAEEKKEC
jgi:hypothetical protein